MPAYMISYDLRKVRNYDALLKALRTMKCISPLKSLWFGTLLGPASEIRKILLQQMDGDDGLVIVELKPGSEWAVAKVNENGGVWLQQNVSP
ncbi:hypothetical protein NOJ28_11395 [Neorhizobium galegae]|uniref:hypothetical protein n=1 Tax=Neorhizobium galegae TaxID=399 RepID=UPI0021061A9F|nr:hypothetical protein [Neorhizobium galegae]MCQ1766140.1 hypothetical protein [Neorhizobium galegae]MCQ1845054.1 hypothetical protein [Neorhizobium galegae]